jgi:hypothetical protein
MPPEKKGKNLRESKSTEKPRCDIQDKIVEGWRDEIRENICVKESEHPLTKYTNGKYYCLFHLPTQEKDITKFEEIFQTRLKEVEEKISAIRELPKDKQIFAKIKISYDFRYVWFPSDVNLENYKFEVRAFFISAIFSTRALFNSAIFSDYASFQHAIFSSYASFNWTKFFMANFNDAIFSNEANYRLAEFSGSASFNRTKFMSITYFEWIKFMSDTSFRATTFSADTSFKSTLFSTEADFHEATFTSDAYFIETTFGRTGSTTFDDTSFAKGALFDRARFRNNVSFYSAMFGSESDVFFRKTFFAKNANFQYCAAQGYVRFSNLRQGKENKFDFQEAAFENASRISFHTVRLFPNWFVNVDARKFVFTDIKWKNLDSERRNKNITAELENLKVRGIKEQSKRLLEIACRQLGVNAEENNRYEEAAKFRYMAMETKRLEELKHFSFSRFLIWLYKWTSSYGENWQHALGVLFIILFGFALIYTQTEFQTCPNNQPLAMSITECKTEPEKCKCQNGGLNIKEAFTHSISTALFQNVEYRKPLTIWGELATYLEKILAPLQAALLALAIRRKFMR